MADCQSLSRWRVFLFSVIRWKSTASPTASLHPVDSVGKHSEIGGVPKKGAYRIMSEKLMWTHGHSLAQPLAGSCVNVHMCVSVCVRMDMHKEKQ